MKAPHFICVGAQKSGTTWLYQQLKKHPHVTLPPLKEIHYFDEVHRGVKTGLFQRVFDDHWMNQRWRTTFTFWLKKIAKLNVPEERWFYHYLFKERGIDWYAKLFDFDDAISGDITPDYTILNRSEVEYIKQAFPDVKIIFLMRNPIERKWSQIKMVLSEKQGMTLNDDTYEKFYDACLNWEDELGDYANVFSTWADVFGEKQFYYDYYDNLKENPVKFYENILSFLGLSFQYEKSDLVKKVYSGKSIELPEPLKDILKKSSFNAVSKLQRYVDDVPTEWLNSPK